MITDDIFKNMQAADPEEAKSFIPHFLQYIEGSSYKDKLRLAIEKKDPNILIDLLYSLPREELDKELSYIIATGRFIYLLRIWNK
jgi:hypothetical protein